MQNKTLLNKNIAISGASSGIGLHLALSLANAGANIALIARNSEKLDIAYNKISEFSPDNKPLTVEMDVTNLHSIQSGLKKIENSFSHIDVLINCAGVGLVKPFLDTNDDDWDFVFNTNLKGMCTIIREVAKKMITNKVEGSIINISSTLADRTKKDRTLYAISKAGVNQLTRQLAIELATYNIRVNAISPGYFITDLNRKFLESSAGQQTISHIPLKRAGKLDELTEIVKLLSSDLSSYITGSIIAVDGGLSASELP